MMSSASTAAVADVSVAADRRSGLGKSAPRTRAYLCWAFKRLETCPIEEDDLRGNVLMSIRDRIIDRCLRPGPSGRGLVWDTDTSLTNLLLFENLVTYESLLGYVVPNAVRLLGYDGVVSLLDENALRFNLCDLFSANLTPNGPSDTFAITPVDEYEWRPGVYRVANISQQSPASALEYLSSSLADASQLTKRRTSKLVDAVSAHLAIPPKNFGLVSTFQTYAEVLRDSSDLRRAVAAWISQTGGAVVTPNDVELSVAVETAWGDDELVIGELRIESNLERKLGLSALEARYAVGEGLLALCRLNARIETMEACDAIFGIRDDESEFVDTKLEFLAREYLPEAQAERFHRVLTIFNLPQMGPAMDDGRLNMHKFLKLRNSEECRQFRTWLRNLDDSTEVEIKERVDSLRARAGNILHNNEGKAARFIVVNGISFVPLVGPAVSIALSGLDEFMVDKVLPESGPVAFLSSRYPSIFMASDTRP